MADLAIMALSEQLGLPVLDRKGHRLGRLGDMTVRLGPGRPQVSRLLVKETRSRGHLVPWDEVAQMTSTAIHLRAHVDTVPVNLARPALEPEEVLLARDVMDTQVVDLRGHRLSRVSEVLLLRTGPALDVAAVDLGTAGLLRRIGLGRLVRHQPPLAVDWPDLHLTSRRGHLVQLSTSAANFRRLDAKGLASLLARLSTPHATDVIRAVEPAHAAAALHHSHPRTGRRLVHALSTAERQDLEAAAATDHALTITEVGRPTSPWRRRRFLRTAGWRRHRPPEE